MGSSPTISIDNVSKNYRLGAGVHGGENFLDAANLAGCGQSARTEISFSPSRSTGILCFVASRYTSVTPGTMSS
jgi:hypothetical protein